MFKNFIAYLCNYTIQYITNYYYSNYEFLIKVVQFLVCKLKIKF